MSEQTETEPGSPSPTVALIDERLTVLNSGENSIGIQEVRIAQMKTDLAIAEADLERCLAEKADLERDRALLAPEIPTDPEETA